MVVRLTLKFIAAHRALVGAKELGLEVPDGTGTTELFGILAARFPGFERLEGHTYIAVNHVYASTPKRLEDGDEVAFFPPLVGG